MCYFVTLGTRKTTDEQLSTEFRGFMLPVTSNPSISKHLPADFRTRLLVSGMCSCDLYSDPAKRNVTVPSVESLREKYRKLGWSAAKIDRATSQASAKPKSTQAHFSGLRSDVAASIAEFARRSGPVAVIVHWYNGDVETEKFEVAQGPRYRAAEFVDAAESFPIDTLLWAEPA